MQETQIWSLVGELRSHMPLRVAKKKVNKIVKGVVLFHISAKLLKAMLNKIQLHLLFSSHSDRTVRIM